MKILSKLQYYNDQKKIMPFSLCFCQFMSPKNALLYGNNLKTISPKYYIRLLFYMVTSIVGSSLRIIENLLYDKKLKYIEIDPPPIIIIGHWRSGTTHLHNLMSLDTNLAYLNNYQTIATGFTIVGGTSLKALFQTILPPSRPMDNVGWSIDSPQEEEFAIGKLGGPSSYAMWFFPKNSLEIVKKNILFDGVSNKYIDNFIQAYLKVLRVAVYTAGGRRLVLKNPANTGRVPLLMKLFPTAKFIHIHRSPYDVYSSSIHLNRISRNIATLQDSDGLNDQEIIITIYEKVMHSFLQNKDLIPEKNFIEVRYEDLEKDPLNELKRIYDKFSLSNFRSLEIAVPNYMNSLVSFQKNSFTLNKEDIAVINTRLKFAFEAFGYPPHPP